MREIKFRAWDKTEQKMFTNGYLGFHGDIFETIDNDELLVRENCIVMQYTGLKDKNGKEIYEGDIIKETPPNIAFRSSPMKVVWSDYSLAFTFDGNTAPHVDFKFMEVIGNIYKNPELLKGTDDKE